VGQSQDRQGRSQIEESMISLRLVVDTNVVVSAAIKPEGLQRTVRSMEGAAVFDGERGELGIGYQGTLGLAIDDHRAQKGPVIFVRSQPPDIRLIQPVVDELTCSFQRAPLAQQFWIGHDAGDSGAASEVILVRLLAIL
jgi:hypothetical protein